MQTPAWGFAQREFGPKFLLWNNGYPSVSEKYAGNSISGSNKSAVKVLCQML